MAKILVVDDEEKIRAILEIILSGEGHEVSLAANGREAMAFLENEAVDLVISDLRMDEMDGFSLLGAIREREMACPVLFITAFATLDSAVEALRLGAVDFLVKPFEDEDVLLAVERALGVRRILAENVRLKKEVFCQESQEREQGIFESAAMKQVREMALRVAASKATVLISGESGTGKELVARYIHRVSERSHDRFVAVNCGAIAPNLLEAELFGHEKGAFTGADASRAGKFEFAGEGTLFLDEIGEMPLEAQVKLLRVIQERSVQRVGGNQERSVACRVICATNRDLAARVKQGTFREDLYYRLAVFPIHLPPLRERREDILPLVEHYVLKHRGLADNGEVLTPAARQLLLRYDWPGNVRELFNAVERAMILKGGRTPFSSDDFPALRAGGTPQRNERDLIRVPMSGLDYDALQRTIVRQALDRTQGNQSAAARLLGVSRARFRTLLGLLGSDAGAKGGSAGERST